MLNEVRDEGEGQYRKDYVNPPPASLIGIAELKVWSFYRALTPEFIASLVSLYITIATIIGQLKQRDSAGTGSSPICQSINKKTNIQKAKYIFFGNLY
ncbi:Major intrinsic protein [Corchorus olitorius]|uniref:Major intrinsic protein n=1 Tax=Corchorus olitorius TaxID=93759 RepID=A0A1R3KRF5_9ROSI|nr:Major intrinsic protein [Corchorus olitorius]